MRLALPLFAALLASSVAPAAEPKLLVATDPQSQPESVTVAPDGSLFLSSASKPVIYRAAKGASQAQIFVDASTRGQRQLSRRPGRWSDQYAVGLRNHRRRQGSPFDPAQLPSDQRCAEIPLALPGEINPCNDFVIASQKFRLVNRLHDTASGHLKKQNAINT